MTYIPLHVHSEYSLLDGAIRLPALARRARELGIPALALTDHGNLHGAVEFSDACVKEGLQPILGCEVYVAPGSRFDKSTRHGLQEAAYHLTLLVKDAEGWANLMQLSTAGYLQGFYYKPRIDRELLARHAKGLVCLSGCLAGEAASLILKGELPLARQLVSDYQSIFGRENYYLEVQDHGLPADARVNAELAALSRELGAPLVATPDCHYLTREEAAAHELLLCVQTGTDLDDPKRLRFETEEFYLKSPEEMRQLFHWAPQALENTLRIAGACGFELKQAGLRLPGFPLPSGSGPQAEAAYLEGLCRAALPSRYPSADPAALSRLEHELGVIRKLGYAGYFLIVRDFVEAARRLGVRVGPGRGSAAGSIVSHLLGITALDPLEHGLLFERFLNPERVSPPDIDVDFADSGRDKVIAYVVEKYGRERVAQIISFGRLAARAALRDVGRALNYGYSEVDHLAKLVPAGPDVQLDKALQEAPELAAAAKEPRPARLLGYARSLEGLARNASTHAAGIVISPGPLVEEVPLCSTGGSKEGDAVVTQFDMLSLERLGLVKMDLLGLRTLSVIDECLRLIRASGAEPPDLERLADGDKATFAMLSEGHSQGVFQLESAGMRDLLRRFKPRDRRDLDALIALFRPGPMRMIDDYLRRREGKERAAAPLPELEPILKDTYGIIVYQEQVMRVAMEVAGFSAARADLLRRAMGKKDHELLERQRADFLAGAKARGVAEAKAEEVFGLLARFAEYGFNRAHSASYALLAYQTAYLKAHHGAAFLAALLSSEAGNVDKTVAALGECRRLGVKVCPPDVNSSGAWYALEEGRIRYGLAAIRNVGLAAVEEGVAAARAKGGQFKDLGDLLGRVDPRLLNLRALEGLVKAGALDSLEKGLAPELARPRLLARLPLAAEQASRAHAERESGQTSMLELMAGAPEGPSSPPPLAAGGPAPPSWTPLEKLAYEKEALGFYVSGHPLDPHERLWRGWRCSPLGRLAEGRDGAPVMVGGIVYGVKHQVTKKQEAMARLTLEDFDGLAEVLLWPRVLAASRELAHKDRLVLVKGKLDLSGDGARVSAEELWPLEQAGFKAKALHLRLRPTTPADALLAWAKSRPGPAKLWLHLPLPGAEAVQRAGEGLGVALDGRALEELDELVESFYLE